MGKGEIWIFGGDAETSRHIAKVLSGLVNPVRTIENGFDFGALVRGYEPPPLLLLLDLSDKRSWDMMNRIVENRMDYGVNMIALVDTSTEHLVDRAFESGVKTYVRKPLVFSDFVQRAKLLKMNVLIHPKGRAPG